MGTWRNRRLRVQEGRKDRWAHRLKTHSHVLCAAAAGCCLAAATLLNCFPSPAKTRIDGLHKLNGSRKRGALCCSRRNLAGGGEAGCGERLSSPGAARERLSLGGDPGAQWGDNHPMAPPPAPSRERRGHAPGCPHRGACLHHQ